LQGKQLCSAGEVVGTGLFAANSAANSFAKNRGGAKTYYLFASKHQPKHRLVENGGLGPVCFWSKPYRAAANSCGCAPRRAALALR
jgi:hypothetical protein